MNKPMNFDERTYNAFVNLYKERTSFIGYANDLGISVNDVVAYYNMACSKGDITTYDKILADEVISLYNHINNMKKSGQLPQDFSLGPDKKRPTKVYPDDVKCELVIILHKSGMTQRKIADKLGISVSMAHCIIRSYKEKNGTYVSYGNRDTINEIIKLNNDGLTVKAIAAKLGIKESTVRTYLSRMRHCDIGKDISPTTHKSEDIMKTIVALRNEGKTGKEIQDITGYSRNTIYNYLAKAKKNGVEIAYDDARDRYIFDLIKPYYDEGLSASEIGRDIGYSHDTISNYIKLGIQKGYLVGGSTGKPLPKYMRVSGMVYKLYKEGQTIAEIAFRLSTSETTVRRALNHATRMEENK